MNLEFLMPGLVLLAAAIGLGLGRRPLPPGLAIVAMTLVASVAAGVVVLLTTATAAGFVLGPARRAELVGWCRGKIEPPESDRRADATG